MQQYNLPSPAEAEWMKAALYTKYSAPTRHEEKGEKKGKTQSQPTSCTTASPLATNH